MDRRKWAKTFWAFERRWVKMGTDKGGRTGKLCTGPLVAALVLIVFCSSVSGGGFETHEQGAKAVAMGNAFIAQADDPSAVYYNPAGITQLERMQASIGVALIHPGATFKSNGNPVMGTSPGQSWEINSNNWFLPNAYFTYKFRNYLSLGFGAFSNFGLGIEWPNDFEGRFTPGTIKTELTTYSLSPVIAVKPVEWLSIGIGPVAQRLTIDLRNYVFVAPPTPPLSPGQNSAETAQSKLTGDDWAWGFNAGALVHLPLNFRFGVSYFSRIQHDINHGTEELTFANGLTQSQGGSSSLDLPSSIKLGLAWSKEPWTFEVGAQWIEWSTYKELKVNFENGTSLVEPKNWTNVWSWQFGAQYRLNQYFDLRAGFRYEQSPIPSSTLDPVVPSGHREVYCVGVGGHFGSMTIDFSYNYIQDTNREWNNSAGNVYVGSFPVTRVTGEFTDGYGHIFALNISYKF
jgi:long-chain fatty acid transport protein